MMIPKEDIYALNLIKNVGQATLDNLLYTYSSINDLIDSDENELNQCLKGAGKTYIIDEIKNNFDKYRDRAEYELNQFYDNEIIIISKWCDEYPERMRVIKDQPPPFLYCKGNIDLLKEEKSVAVIGTRNATDEGFELGHLTAKFFADKGYNIVSGLATGIDTSAHQAALFAEGKTTAVLVDIQNIYPKENLLLSDDICNGDGLLFAENIPGTTIQGPLFARRDRLQSALSKAVFPIETDVAGGTMHTVEFAQKQKKKIFCPDLSKEDGYPINNPMAKGIRMLINEGKAEPYSIKKLDKVLKHIEDITDEDSRNNQSSWGGGKQMKMI